MRTENLKAYNYFNTNTFPENQFAYKKTDPEEDIHTFADRK